MRSQVRTRSWIDTTNLVLAVMLFCAPWVVGPASAGGEWNAWIVGGLVAFNAGCALTGFAAWEEWTNLGLGMWAVISPWVFGFQGNSAATSTSVILGCGVAGFAAIQLWLLNRQHAPAAG